MKNKNHYGTFATKSSWSFWRKPKTVAITAAILLNLLFAFGITGSAQAYIGLPFGGRTLFFSPPVFTGIVNCPAIVHVANIGPGKGVLHLFFPAAQPRLFYNFFTPGIANLGSYYPTPLLFNCPVQPIYPANFFGTSAR